MGEAIDTPMDAPVEATPLDAAPVGTCQGCHNIDGYSLNPTVRKVHGAHRGEHLTNPGVAHPEYGLGADATLAEYVNIGFPAIPDGEKDCVKCHRDDRWRTAPSRLGCGTCHDAVFFDRGTLEPPRRQTKTCKLDADCATPGGLATCNLAAGLCEIAVHPSAPMRVGSADGSPAAGPCQTPPPKVVTYTPMGRATPMA